jgi:hypothetical protein
MGKKQKTEKLKQSGLLGKGMAQVIDGLGVRP